VGTHGRDNQFDCLPRPARRAAGAGIRIHIGTDRLSAHGFGFTGPGSRMARSFGLIEKAINAVYASRREIGCAAYVIRAWLAIMFVMYASETLRARGRI